jgi:hypothetical protein
MANGHELKPVRSEQALHDCTEGMAGHSFRAGQPNPKKSDLVPNGYQF